MTVFASLGGGHIDYFARAVLNDDKPVLPQGRALHRIRGRGASIGRIKGMLMLRFGVSCGSFST